MAWAERSKTTILLPQQLPVTVRRKVLREGDFFFMDWSSDHNGF